MTRRAWLTMAALALTTVPAIAAPGGEKLPAAAWTPDKARLGQLAPEVKVSGFRIRPPKGYVLQQQTHGTGRGFSWVGRSRDDGTRPYLMVLIMTPPPGETNNHTPEQALDALLAGVQRRRQDWQQSATERGQVNGREFVRARWSGVDSISQQKMHGFSYVTVSGPTIVQLSSQDVEPHHPAALALAEAAALTFRMP